MDYKKLNQSQASYSLPLIVTQKPPASTSLQPSSSSSTASISALLSTLPPAAPLQHDDQFLPSIRNTVGRTTSRLEASETSFVVGTRPKSSQNQDTTVTKPQHDESPADGALPASWTQQEIVARNDLQRTKVEWENDLARHILSLYASSTANRNIKESQLLLEFVGERDSEGHAGGATNKVPKFHSSSTQHHDSIPEENDEDEDEDEQHHGKSGKGSKKKKKGKKKKAITAAEAEADEAAAAAKKEKQRRKADQAQQNKALITDVLRKIDKQMSLSRVKDKYRVTNTIRTKHGQDIVVRGSPRCFPIWFVSNGDVYANWTSLPGGRKLQAHLQVLYESRYYAEYIQILEAVIVQLWRGRVFGKEEFAVGSFGKEGATPAATRTNTAQSGTRSKTNTASDGMANQNQGFWYDNILAEKVPQDVRQEMNDRFDTMAVHPWKDPASTNNNQQQSQPITSPTKESAAQHKGREGNFNNMESFFLTPKLTVQELEVLWVQLIMTTIAIGLLCVEKKDFDLAMQFFNIAESYTKNDDILTSKQKRKGSRAYIKDAMAFYFFRKGRAVAALAYSQQALEIFDQFDNVEGVGTCLLHIASTHCQVGNFKESHRVLYQFLAMVETGRLSTVEATPKQLCLVAVAYHNLAVIQLKLDLPDLACKNSHNARRIARLCLSYSNRYIDVLQHTHEVAINDMKHELEQLDCNEMTREQAATIAELAEALFTIETSI